MVPAGSLFVVRIAGQAGSLWAGKSLADAQADIAAQVIAEGFRPVYVVLNNVNAAGGLLPSIGSFPYTGELAVRTTFDYARDADVLFQLQLALNGATGSAGTVAVVSANDDPSEADPDAPTASSPWGSLLHTLQTDAGIVLALVAVVVVVAIVAVGKDALKAVVA